MSLFSLLLPELIVTAAALVLFLFGVFKSARSRAIVPWIALLGLVGGGAAAFFLAPEAALGAPSVDFTRSIVGGDFATYVKVVVAAVGVILLLLCWPTNKDNSGNGSLWWGLDAGEFFGLFLLSFVGIMLVAGANDTMLLFMGIELASIPTYVLVAMSRPLPEAQEAGVKYFYLGAMAAAVLLLGFAYLYGAVGSTNLSATALAFAEGRVSPAMSVGTWQTLGVVLIVLGLCFKLAAVPLHFYAGDVYTGAATPVTAMLSFVPKATGILATVKLLLAVGGSSTTLAAGVTFDPTVWKVLFALAVLTMTVGNAMALLAENIKRVMAYSSIAHSGYMLAALTVVAAAVPLGGGVQTSPIVGAAVAGVLFYLAAYGVMNAGVFGVLMMLPSRRRFTDGEGKEHRLPATTAETYADIRGAGRRHPYLTAAMAVCCISLIGIPLTVGFLGKFFVLRPALLLADKGSDAAFWPMTWLIIITLLNAAIAAAYYLRILSEMVLLKSPEEEEAGLEGEAFTPKPAPDQPLPIVLATGLSVAGIFVFGLIPMSISALADSAAQAATATKVMPAEMMPTAEELAARRARIEAMRGTLNSNLQRGF